MCNFSIKYNVYNSLCPLAKILMILRALAICSGVKCNITSIPHVWRVQAQSWKRPCWILNDSLGFCLASVWTFGWQQLIFNCVTLKSNILNESSQRIKVIASNGFFFLFFFLHDQWYKIKGHCVQWLKLPKIFTVYNLHIHFRLFQIISCSFSANGKTSC